jgi:polar amino acid transport system ATP-binding protein
MDQGKIIEEGTPSEFFDHPKTDRAKQFLNTFSFEKIEKPTGNFIGSIR